MVRGLAQPQERCHKLEGEGSMDVSPPRRERRMQSADGKWGRVALPVGKRYEEQESLLEQE